MAEFSASDFHYHATQIWDHARRMVDDLRKRVKNLKKGDEYKKNPLLFYERLDSMFDRFGVQRPTALRNAQRQGTSDAARIKAASSTINDLQYNFDAQKNSTGKGQLPAVLALLWDFHPEVARDYYYDVADALPSEYASVFREFSKPDPSPNLNLDVGEANQAPHDRFSETSGRNPRAKLLIWSVLATVIIAGGAGLAWLALDAASITSIQEPQNAQASLAASDDGHASAARPEQIEITDDLTDTTQPTVSALENGSRVREEDIVDAETEEPEQFPKTDDVREPAVQAEPQRQPARVPPGSVLAGLIVSESSLFAGEPQSGTVDLVDESGFDSLSGFSLLGPGSIDFEGASSASGLTSKGKPITLVSVANRIVGHAGGEPVFEASVNSNGAFAFSLLGALDHAPNSDQISIQIPVRASDLRASEEVRAIVQVEVLDDEPDIVDVYCEAFETWFQTQRVIQVSGNPMSAYKTPFEFGMDGRGGLHLTGEYWASNVYEGDPIQVTSSGAPVRVNFNKNTAVGYLDEQLEPVFEFSINGYTGAYIFKQFLPLDQQGSGDSLTTYLNFQVETKDGDGDVKATWVQIDVHDECVSDCSSVPAYGSPG